MNIVISSFSLTGACLLSAALIAQSPPRASVEAFGTGCSGTGGHVQIATPASASEQMGSTNSNIPQGIAQTRYQQILRWEDLGQAGRTLIGLGFRQDDMVVAPDDWEPQRQLLEIRLCRTDIEPEAMSAYFDENLSGGDEQTVFDGWVDFPRLTGTNQDPSRFDAYIPFDTPFSYVALQRNLLIEVRNKGTISDPVLTYDAHETVDTSRLHAPDLSGVSGTLERGVGLVLAFRTDESTAGTPRIGNTGLPVLGQQFTIDLLDACKRSAATLMIGASDKSWGVLNLPFDLAPLGAPGCWILASGEVMQSAPIDIQGRAEMLFSIPSDAAFVGAYFFTQWIAVDLPASGLGVCLSDAAKVTVGL